MPPKHPPPHAGPPHEAHPHPPHHRPGHGPHGPHGGAHPPGHGHGPGHRPPASRALSFLDIGRLDVALAPVVPGPGDRAFLLRCLVGEGPIHHRGANYVLIVALAHLLESRAQPTPAAEEGAAVRSVPVPMRLPPHLADQVDDGHYPIGLPTALLERLAGGDAAHLAAMTDCLTDGPPQHALANVVMVNLLERLWADRNA